VTTEKYVVEIGDAAKGIAMHTGNTMDMMIGTTTRTMTEMINIIGMINMIEMMSTMVVIDTAIKMMVTTRHPTAKRGIGTSAIVTAKIITAEVQEKHATGSGETRTFGTEWKIHLMDVWRELWTNGNVQEAV